MKRIAFICAKGLETFIDPIVKELDKSYDYVVDRQYLNLQDGQEKISKQITKVIDWADIIWYEWVNEVAIFGTNDKTFPEIKDKKVIVRLHSYEALTDMPKQIGWENVDRLVYVSEHIREIVNTYELIPCDTKYVIIPNGVNLSKFRASIKEPDPYNIAFVGYINYKKNPSMMLQIMQKLVLRNPLFKLYIAGSYQDRRYEVYLPYMIVEMQLERNVFFDGWVENMNKWYQNKSILLSTSLHEGHSYCIMEAMARQITPIIHNYFGASAQYPQELLFNTVDQAVYLIEETLSSEHKTSWLREYIIDKDWTFKAQFKQIKELIDEI